MGLFMAWGKPWDLWRESTVKEGSVYEGGCEEIGKFGMTEFMEEDTLEPRASAVGSGYSSPSPYMCAAPACMRGSARDGKRGDIDARAGVVWEGLVSCGRSRASHMVV